MTSEVFEYTLQHDIDFGQFYISKITLNNLHVHCMFDTNTRHAMNIFNL